MEKQNDIIPSNEVPPNESEKKILELESENYKLKKENLKLRKELDKLKSKDQPLPPTLAC